MLWILAKYKIVLERVEEYHWHEL